jgi:hypothetical protein
MKVGVGLKPATTVFELKELLGMTPIVKDCLVFISVIEPHSYFPMVPSTYTVPVNLWYII